MEIDRLIDNLTRTAQPVRVLLPPRARAAIWLTVALPYIALVVYVVAPRPDLVEKLAQSRYLLEQAAALATGIAAATAAFATTIPGYSRRVVLLPLVPLAVWLGSLGQGCLQDWLQFGPSGLAFRPDWFCFPAIVLVGAAPAIAMAMMLRRGAPLAPYVSTALGGLAAAGLGNFGLRLFHMQDASLMVLVWQVGSVAVLTIAAACGGRILLSWRSIIGAMPKSAFTR
jgi:hypothetical protein